MQLLMLVQIYDYIIRLNIINLISNKFAHDR